MCAQIDIAVDTEGAGAIGVIETEQHNPILSFLNEIPDRPPFEAAPFLLFVSGAEADDDQFRPRIDALKVEVHVLDHEVALYGQPLEVEFVARLRDVAKFGSAEELVTQLQSDIKAVRDACAT